MCVYVSTYVFRAAPQKRGDGFLLAIGSVFSMLDGFSVPALGFTFTKLAVSLFRTDPHRIEAGAIPRLSSYVFTPTSTPALHSCLHSFMHTLGLTLAVSLF